MKAVKRNYRDKINDASTIICLDNQGNKSNIQSVIDEQNKNLNGLSFGVDASGNNYGYIKPGETEVTPFGSVVVKATASPASISISVNNQSKTNSKTLDVSKYNILLVKATVGGSYNYNDNYAQVTSGSTQLYKTMGTHSNYAELQISDYSTVTLKVSCRHSKSASTTLTYILV